MIDEKIAKLISGIFTEAENKGPSDLAFGERANALMPLLKEKTKVEIVLKPKKMPGAAGEFYSMICDKDDVEDEECTRPAAEPSAVEARVSQMEEKLSEIGEKLDKILSAFNAKGNKEETNQEAV